MTSCPWDMCHLVPAHGDWLPVTGDTVWACKLHVVLAFWLMSSHTFLVVGQPDLDLQFSQRLPLFQGSASGKDRMTRKVRPPGCEESSSLKYAMLPL